MANPVQEPVAVTRDIGGRPLTIETGRMARQSAGAVTVRQGDTIVLVAVTSGPGRPGQDFFPLTCDYRESTSAAGKFPGGFFKREARPSTKETLVSRVIDRPCRPLFPKGYMDEVLVSALVISADQENDPDVLSMVGASAALAISGLPWAGPIGACRVGRVDGQVVVNPTYKQREAGELDLVIAATKSAITMVEAAANELPEDLMLDALFEGERVSRELALAIEELAGRCNVKKQVFTPPAEDEALKAKVMAWLPRVLEANYTPGKHARAAALKALRDEAIAALTAGLESPALDKKKEEVKKYWEGVVKTAVRKGILDHGKRADGRGVKDIRPITVELGLLPRAHGSTLFTRGETQGLISLTLGTVMDDQRVEGLTEPVRQKFMLHYNFPAYSVGESWGNRGPKRREIGHGNLAERALKPIIPDYEQFPYTVRIRSDITESNGSSSMATVCGGTLALMDGGVPIRRPVAGIAMGMVSETGKNLIISDILGTEDACGDMDFKVAGTQTGITALQMDIKMDGLSRQLMAEALEQARDGRIYILKKMLRALQQPRAAMSAYAPKLRQVPIDGEKIGALIGPGGKTIRKIQEETSTKIEIDEERGIVVIASVANKESNLDVAEQMVRALASEVQIGTRYTGRVVSVRDFGCFVEMLPGLEGLVHVSELAEGYVERVRDVVNEGDVIEVEVIDVDQQGRVKLSRKRAMVPPGTLPPPTPREEGGRGRPGGGGGGRGRSREPRERSHSGASE